MPLMGRITGSASIDTLVRVGLEKEDLYRSAEVAKHPTMVLLHDFQPCVEDELSALKGTRVTLLYKDNDWVYVVAEDGREGFVPYAYCAPLSAIPPSPRNKPDRPPAPPNYENIIEIRNNADMQPKLQHLSSGVLRRDSPMIITEKSVTAVPQDSDEYDSDIFTFDKHDLGRYIVLFNFVAQQENDLNVMRGEFVTVLNMDDPDWYWILRSDKKEGFVPRAFLCPAHSQGSFLLSFVSSYMCVFSCKLMLLAYSLNKFMAYFQVVLVQITHT